MENTERNKHKFGEETCRGGQIVVGAVKPHPFLCYGGTLAASLHGISSIETIHQNLKLSLGSKAENGSIAWNPVFEDAIEAYRLTGVDFREHSFEQNVRSGEDLFQ